MTKRLFQNEKRSEGAWPALWRGRTSEGDQSGAKAPLREPERGERSHEAGQAAAVASHSETASKAGGERIGFAGLSHLGLISSICIASKGFEVVGYDPDPKLVDALARGEFPVFEPGLAELFAKSRIRFTADASELAGCAVVYLAKDVPTDAEGRSDLEPLLGLALMVLPQLREGCALVVHSQVPPGFTRQLFERLGAPEASRRLALYYQVETLIFGRAVERALQPERYIVGSAGGGLVPAYAKLLSAYGCPVFEMRYESAELAKISINLFLISTVCTTNMLAEICEKTGAAWSEIAPTLKLDRRIGPYAYIAPGLGISGGNLERDMATVARLGGQLGAHVEVASAFARDSAYRKNWVARKLRDELKLGRGCKLALWGLAYKADTRSIKNSPAIELIRELHPNGFTFTAYDPQVEDESGEIAKTLHRAASPLEACRDADALAIMTPWPEFSGIDLGPVVSALRGKKIVDPLGVLAKRADALPKGTAYWIIGNSSQ